jgi:hypothetical protein
VDRGGGFASSGPAPPFSRGELAAAPADANYRLGFRCAMAQEASAGATVSRFPGWCRSLRTKMSGHRTPTSVRLRHWGCAAAIGLALGVEPTAAIGSVTVRLDVDALGAGADVILVGTVESTEAHFASPANRAIVTDVTLRSELGILGVADGSRFVVRHLGGEVGAVGQRVFGEASFHPGEHLLLFAVERRGAYWALGMSQGVWPVTRDDAGNEFVVEPTGAREKLDDVVGRVRAVAARRVPR